MDTVSLTKNLRGEVEEALVLAGPMVRERVKSFLVEEKLKERTNLVLDGFSKREEAQRTLNKIRPDSVLFNEKGEKTQEAYSKAKLEERKKAIELLNRIDNALSLALGETPNYEKLLKLASGKAESEPVAGEE